MIKKFINQIYRHKIQFSLINTEKNSEDLNYMGMYENHNDWCGAKKYFNDTERREIFLIFNAPCTKKI